MMMTMATAASSGAGHEDVNPSHVNDWPQIDLIIINVEHRW
jgi:hypothetical protein